MWFIRFWGDAENARPENDGQKLRGLENAGLENDGQTCGHSRFCAQCADAVAVMPNGYPLCRIHLLTWLCVCIFDVYLANCCKTLLKLD